MSILFSEIYTKAINLFDDPKITIAYETNQIQFHKIMYNFLQNAISMFTNPVSIGVRLSSYTEPIGTMEVFEGDGVTKEFQLSDEFELLPNSLYDFIQGSERVEAEIDIDARKVTFPEVLAEGEQYAIEQYFPGEFTEDFVGLNQNTQRGNALIVGQVKDILARLLVKAWAENERNLLTDIRNILQDTDFKLHPNASSLKSKNEWVNQLDNEIQQYQTKLAWNIRFLNGSNTPGIGRG